MQNYTWNVYRCKIFVWYLGSKTLSTGVRLLKSPFDDAIFSLRGVQGLAQTRFAAFSNGDHFAYLWRRPPGTVWAGITNGTFPLTIFLGYFARRGPQPRYRCIYFLRCSIWERRSICSSHPPFEFWSRALRVYLAEEWYFHRQLLNYFVGQWVPDLLPSPGILKHWCSARQWVPPF